MVEPTGVPEIIDMRIPTSAQTMEDAAENIVTFLKFLKMNIAETAGKIMSAEIRSEPTRFIASTIMTAMKTAIMRL